MVTVINVIGGLIVGMVQHDMSFGDAIKNYTLLAIGDGLVAQIPSLVISIAAGMVVSRVASDQDEIYSPSSSKAAPNAKPRSSGIACRSLSKNGSANSNPR